MILALLFAVFVAHRRFDFFPEDFDLIIGLGFGFAVGNILAAFSNIRSDDRLYALLMRYVDSDAEALSQIADRDSGSTEGSAESEP